MKRFVTLFPTAKNAHLIKDLGQIPWYMYQLHGYDSRIATYASKEECSHLEGEVKGLKIDRLENLGRKSFWELGVVKYLEDNAVKIDVLNLYHLTKESIYYGNLYKKLNPNGKLYLKMDAYNHHINVSSVKYSGNFIKNQLLKSWEKKFVKNVDVFTIENTQGLKLLKKLFPQQAHKMHYMPNGVNDVFLKEHFQERIPFEEKKNVLLSVTRVGSPEKNVEMLLDCLPKLNLKNWEVWFVGPIEDHFTSKIESWYQEFPELKEKVLFKGAISDRKQLYDQYNRAKICCVTSPFESFGIAFIEAMYFGNYIIGTNGASAFKDISNGGKHGAQVEVNDTVRLKMLLQSFIDDDQLIKNQFSTGCAHIQENFSWSVLTGKLNQWLTQ